MSEQLATSYRVLERQVEHLNRELRAARAERQRQRAAREQLADRLEKLVQTLPVGVLVLNAEGRVTEANAIAVALLGEPLEGEEWSDVIARSYQGEDGTGHEVQLKGGRWVNISARPLEGDSGRILVLDDVTETRRLQQALERQHRLSALGEVVARLAHQVRTPLASALLYAEHLGDPALAPEKGLRFAARLHDNLRHIEHMVDDMLAFARGDGPGQGEHFSVGTLLERLRRLVGPAVAEAGVDWAIEIPDRVPALYGNCDILASALANLVANSLQVLHPGESIHTRVRPGDDGWIELEFQDQGPGIDPAIRERIFEPFFTTRARGTGLGLAVVRATVSAFGGDIRLLQEPAGGGATFRIRLPGAGMEQALCSTHVHRSGRTGQGAGGVRTHIQRTETSGVQS